MVASAPPRPRTSFALTASTASPSASVSCSCVTSERNWSEIGPSLTFWSTCHVRSSTTRSSSARACREQRAVRRSAAPTRRHGTPRRRRRSRCARRECRRPTAGPARASEWSAADSAIRLAPASRSRSRDRAALQQVDLAVRESPLDVSSRAVDLLTAGREFSSPSWSSSRHSRSTSSASTSSSTVPPPLGRPRMATFLNPAAARAPHPIGARGSCRE